MRCGLIAEKLGHSFSPEIHRMLGCDGYQLVELKNDEFEAFMKKRDFEWINVTIPYKRSVIPCLDWIDGDAARIGAVNTVVNKGGRLCGYNTDVYGVKALIARAGLDVKGKKALILGSGGTSHTAFVALKDLGAEEVCFVRRDNRENALTYKEAYQKHGDAYMILNATPCGMFPNNGELPKDEDGKGLDLSRFSRLQGVVDVIYNPLTTALLLDAQKRGLKNAGGLYMLVLQAAYAEELFTGEPFGQAQIEKVYEQLLASKENVVLTGMPGSGKSTVGKLIAKELDRPFVDLDEEIVKRAQKTIPQIFAQDGEKCFRLLENAVVKEVSKRLGVVISTGGGCVLLEENVRLLKMNGRLCFLDRASEALIPTGDRPLADSEEKIRKLYEKRLPIYRASADLILSVDKGPEQTAKEVICLFRRNGRNI